MGTVPNVGLMVRKAERIMAHMQDFEITKNGFKLKSGLRMVGCRSGHPVLWGDIGRNVQPKIARQRLR